MTSSSPTEKNLDDGAKPRRAQGELALAVAQLDVDAGALRDERGPGVGPTWELHHDSQTLSVVHLLDCVCRDGAVLPPDALDAGPPCVPDREPQPEVAV